MEQRERDWTVEEEVDRILRIRCCSWISEGSSTKFNIPGIHLTIALSDTSLYGTTNTNGLAETEDAVIDGPDSPDVDHLVSMLKIAAVTETASVLMAANILDDNYISELVITKLYLVKDKDKISTGIIVNLFYCLSHR